MRIVSFLPSATELAFSLGLGDDVVGVSHECDYPAEARTRPAVVHCAIPLDDMSPAEIDSAVSTQLRVAGSIYTVDTELLRASTRISFSRRIFARSARHQEMRRSAHSPP